MKVIRVYLDPETQRKADELRAHGVSLQKIAEKAINAAYTARRRKAQSSRSRRIKSQGARG